MNKLHTTAEAAHMLGVSIRRVQQLIKLGELATIPVNAQIYLIDPEAIRIAGERNTKPGRPPKKKE